MGRYRCSPHRKSGRVAHVCVFCKGGGPLISTSSLISLEIFLPNPGITALQFLSSPPFLFFTVNLLIPHQIEFAPIVHFTPPNPSYLK
jgi:hypothetical protein